MSAPQLKHVLVRSGPDYVDDSRGVLLLVEALEHEVTAVRPLIVHQVEYLALRLDHERVCFLADFTFERLPVERSKVGRRLHRLFYL